MTAALDLMASALIGAMAVAYMYALNDRWRVSLQARVVLFLLAGPAALWFGLSPFMRALPVVVRVALYWLVLLPVCWSFSAVRDARFLFVAATSLLFTYLSTTVCSMACFYLPIHRTLLRLLLDGAFLAFHIGVFRPVFLEVYHTMKRGWLVFSLMPICLCSLFLFLLLTPNYDARRGLPHVQIFTYLLALLSLIFYWASFYFFQKLGHWQEKEVDSAVLTAQVTALARPREADLAAEEQRRILRHDLRHYLHILSSCLRAGDGPAALQTMEAIRAGLRSAGLDEEVRHDQ